MHLKLTFLDVSKTINPTNSGGALKGECGRVSVFHGQLLRSVVSDKKVATLLEFPFSRVEMWV